MSSYFLCSLCAVSIIVCISSSLICSSSGVSFGVENPPADIIFTKSARILPVSLQNHGRNQVHFPLRDKCYSNIQIWRN